MVSEDFNFFNFNPTVNNGWMKIRFGLVEIHRIIVSAMGVT